MAVPLYTLQLNQTFIPGLVTIGKYDGSHSCITAATNGDKVLVHTPHIRDKELSVLNVNQPVTAICAGRLRPDDNRDVLLIGTQTTLLAYDVENNTDLFYKEVPDGVNAIVVGRLGQWECPLAVVGGNCSLQGFDWRGDDPFWTVTGDRVRSLALLDIDHDGENELIVGSDDFELRIFKGDALIYEITETEAVTSLSVLESSKFSYSLTNGTVGVYDKQTRLWRVKSKNAAVCLWTYDIDGDGSAELITGWSNGKVDARNHRTGEVVFRDVLGHGVSGIVVGDYAMTGKPQLIVCSIRGEVRGYDSSCVTKDHVQRQGDTVRDLFSKKQMLLTELKNYTADPTGSGIPANTRLLTEINVKADHQVTFGGHVEVALSTNNSTVVRVATVFAEGIFEGETFVVHPQPQHVTNHLTIPLVPPNDTPLDIHIRAFVGPNAFKTEYHVFEVTRQLPRFSMYALASPITKTIPDSYATFQLSFLCNQLEAWQMQNFLAAVGSSNEERGGEGPSGADWSASLTCLRDGSPLHIRFRGTTITVATPHISLAADIVQSLAVYLNLDRVESVAEFPALFTEVEENLNRLEELKSNATRMAAAVADTANLIRSLIVRAEDARLLGHMKDLRECYVQLQQVNGDLVRGHSVRVANHRELLATLHSLNAVIQHSSKLRSE
ncbi:hypothetical protein AAG570_011036 [Ranatra chinensis]|uniref:Bardet-Biedl syndrome 2 protein homolog n=1 Tax=Ranatra chinensis TaxID=642074 RepID=A0ABD0YLK3_9HEMI